MNPSTHQSASIDDGQGQGAWTPHTVAVWQSWSNGPWLAFKTNFNGPWHLSDDGGKTAIFTDEYLQEVMKQARAIEARKPRQGHSS